MTSSKWAIYLFLICFVAIAMTIGTYLLIGMVNETKGKVKIDAVVIGYEEKYFVENGLMYSETVEYVVDGVTYTAQNKTWSRPPEKIGTTMKIAYDPNDPQNYVFVSSKMIFPVGVYIISGVGLICLIVQIVGDVKKRKMHRSQQSNLLVD